MVTNKQGKKILLEKVNQTMKRLRNLDKTTTKAVLSSMTKLKRQIANDLKDVGAGRFNMSHLKTIQRELDGKIKDFESRLSGIVNDSQASSFKAGANLSDDVMKTAGFITGTARLSDELLVTANKFSAKTIKNLTSSMRMDINRSLRRSILTGENNFQSARRIDKILGIKKNLGYMNRSDVIARTETNRMFSIARQAKDEQVVEQVPNMKKQWLTAGDSRVRPSGPYARLLFNHRRANGQIKKVDEPFNVSGERLMFPRDPIGSPENVVNCRCQSVPYMEEWNEE